MQQLPLRCGHSYPCMSRFIKRLPALCQARASQLGELGRQGKALDLGKHLKQQSPVWLPGRQSTGAPVGLLFLALKCSKDLLNQLLIKVAFWNSKTLLPLLSLFFFEDMWPRFIWLHLRCCYVVLMGHFQVQELTRCTSLCYFKPYLTKDMHYCRGLLPREWVSHNPLHPQWAEQDSRENQSLWESTA